VATESVERDALQEFIAVLAIAELGRDGDGLGVAGDEVDEALLEAGDDILVALEVLHRATAFGGVEDVTLVVLQGVFDADDGVLGYAHGDWDG
jgi:hypothetical protein